MRKIKLRQMLAIFMMVANVLVVWGQTPTTASNPFSQTIEEANQQGKWYVIRSYNQKDGESYGWRVRSNKNVATSPISVVDDESLWCFVGTATNFKIYNKSLGNSWVVVTNGASANNTTIVKMVESTSMSDFYWTLGNAAGGFNTLHVKGNTVSSPNAYGGVGNDIKLYNTGDNGSRWKIEKPASVISDFFTTTE